MVPRFSALNVEGILWYFYFIWVSGKTYQQFALGFYLNSHVASIRKCKNYDLSKKIVLLCLFTFGKNLFKPDVYPPTHYYTVQSVGISLEYPLSFLRACKTIISLSFFQVFFLLSNLFQCISTSYLILVMVVGCQQCFRCSSSAAKTT